MFEDRPLLLEKNGDNDHAQLFSTVFMDIKRIRNELLDEILFSEELPPLRQ